MTRDKKTITQLSAIINIAIIAPIVTLLLFIVAFYILFKISNPTIVKKDIINDFHKNQELIFIAKDYLEESEYMFDEIFISKFDGKTSIKLEGGGVPLDDNILSAFKQLLSKDDTRIDKKANCIIFQRGNKRENDMGIVYSIDGHTPDEESITYLTLLEPLPEDGWYYFEADYK